MNEEVEKRAEDEALKLFKKELSSLAFSLFLSMMLLFFLQPVMKTMTGFRKSLINSSCPRHNFQHTNFLSI